MEIYTVNSLSACKIHLGVRGKVPLCGSELYNPKLTKDLFIYDNIDLQYKELRVSKLQGDKLIIVQDYLYCKRCLLSVRNKITSQWPSNNN
jgi:hypothetical protein